jgi:protein SCO1/2
LLVAVTARAQSPQAVLLRDVGITQRLNAQVPLDLRFTDETGTPVHLATLARGKPILLVLVYYRCPSLCTAVLNDMLSSLKVIPQTVGNEFDVWTVSFDPTETADLAAAKKREYLRSYTHTRPAALSTASAGWHFLTGDAASIAALTAAVGYRYRWDDPSRQYIHPAVLTLLTPAGRISRYFFGVDYDPTDVRLALVEASGGRIGTLTDKFLLYCYHYDPATGRYGLAVANALRAGGAVTTLLLAGGLALLWRADRRRTRRLQLQFPQAAPTAGPPDADPGRAP